VAPTSPLLRRVALLLALVAASWSYVLAQVPAGIVLQMGSVRLSSRNPLNPFLLAVVSAALALALAPAGRRWGTLTTDALSIHEIVPRQPRALWSDGVAAVGRMRRRLPGEPHAATVATLLLAAAIVVLGIGRGALVAGGSDSYGYVSQAQLWASGTLRTERPSVALELNGLVPDEAFAPLAYLPSPDGTFLVPMYSPGLPMLMGVFARVGGAQAVFFVVPLLAGLAIVATYVLGRLIGGPAVGLTAAVLLAVSPIFLFQLTSAPLSDLPAAAWWTLALVLAGRASGLGAGTAATESSPRSGAACAAGLAAGAAILIRPNLAPLAAVPAALLLWQAARASVLTRVATRRILLYGIGPTSSVLAICALNTYWYGSPFSSGYGSLEQYFSWDHASTNLVRYTRWLIETQTPLVCLGAAAPWLTDRATPARAHRALVLAAVALAIGVFASYTFYSVFDDWWYLRFLLPGIPALLVLTSASMWALTARLRHDARTFLPVIFTVLAAVHGVGYAWTQRAFNPEDEWRYAAAGQYIAQQLPERAVVLAMHHSGNARYYSGRVVLRYDLVPPAQLDPALDALRRLGYRPYILLDRWEEEVFRAAHQTTSVLGALDWPPLAILQPGDVRIYDPDEAPGSRP
jgi:4-amino-4-deoxy-L-arabinose transferase-like glycosyltransferase